MSEPSTQHARQLVEFLQGKMRSPDHAGEVIVRRHEVEEWARSVGLDETAAWRMFSGSKDVVWRGQYMEESRSEERGYNAVRLWRVHS